MTGRRALALSLAAVVGACAPPIRDEPHPNEGEGEGEGEGDPSDAGPSDEGVCGPDGQVDFSRTPPTVTANCVIRSNAQLALFNDLAIETSTGSLRLQLVASSEPDATFVHLRNVNVLEVGQSTTTQSVHFPALVQADRFDMHDNEVLTAFDAPNFAQVTEHFSIDSNPIFPTCDAQAVYDALGLKPPDATITENCDSCCP